MRAFRSSTKRELLVNTHTVRAPAFVRDTFPSTRLLEKTRISTDQAEIEYQGRLEVVAPTLPNHNCRQQTPYNLRERIVNLRLWNSIGIHLDLPDRVCNQLHRPPRRQEDGLRKPDRFF